MMPTTSPALTSVRTHWLRVAAWYLEYGSLVRRVGNVLLFLWFVWQTYARISFFVRLNFPLGIDATIYYRGVVAWLDGSDPWAASLSVNGYAYHYAGSPVTTVLMAPASLLGEQLFTYCWLGLTLAATVWTLRRLHFPLWWLLFPPIAEGLFSGNPQLVVLALLVANNSVASALATGLKVYAFIPLFGETRWRQIGIAVLFNAATILVAPGLWLDYLRELGSISSRLEVESLQGLSAFYHPMLLAICIVALVLARSARSAGGGLAGGARDLAVEPVPLFDDGPAGDVAAAGRPAGLPVPATATGGDRARHRPPARKAIDHACPDHAGTAGRGPGASPGTIRMTILPRVFGLVRQNARGGPSCSSVS